MNQTRYAPGGDLQNPWSVRQPGLSSPSEPGFAFRFWVNKGRSGPPVAGAARCMGIEPSRTKVIRRKTPFFKSRSQLGRTPETSFFR